MTRALSKWKICASVLVASALGAATIGYHGGYFDFHRPHEPLIGEHQPVSAVPDPVSIAAIGGGKYAIASYENLRIWDSSSNEVTFPQLSKPASFDRQIPGKLVDHWHPTGAAFHDGKLYVANYIFRDVLIFTLDDEETTLTLTGVLNDPAMASPENVAVTDKGIAVVDYDASGVFFFSHDGRLQWKDTSLEQAHGVAIDDTNVYVTTLAGSEKLKRYSLSGQPVATKESFAELQYPTQVSVFSTWYGSQRIAVIDANRGTIATYEHDLKKLDEIGGLGPDMFNRPYGFAPYRGGFVVTDTKNHRILTVDKAGSQTSALPFSTVTNLGTRSNWGNGYAYCSDSKLTKPVYSNQFDQVAGFDTICTMVGGSMYSQILLPHYRSTPNALKNRPVPGFAFSWQGGLTVDDNNYWLIGSPTTNVVMITDQDGNRVFAQHPWSTNVWSVKGAEPYLTDVVRRSRPALEHYRDLRSHCSPLFAFLDAGDAIHARSLDEQLDAVMEYPNARQAAKDWLQGKPLPPETIKALIEKGPTSLDDLEILSNLGVSASLKERQVWEACRGQTS